MAKKPSITRVKGKTKTAAVSQIAKPKDNLYVIIDYPQEGEVMNSEHYALRIGASPDGYVEISVDGSDWQACRWSDGFWWHDWIPSSGAHKITARLNRDGVIVKKSTIRKCSKS